MLRKRDNRLKMELLVLRPMSPNQDLIPNLVTVFNLSQEWNLKPVSLKSHGQY